VAPGAKGSHCLRKRAAVLGPGLLLSVWLLTRSACVICQLIQSAVEYGTVGLVLPHLIAFSSLHRLDGLFLWPVVSRNLYRHLVISIDAESARLVKLFLTDVVHVNETIIDESRFCDLAHRERV
jgi:hypothetical protein